MITCTLGEKKYSVDFISGRALREMEPAAKMYSRVVAIANAAGDDERQRYGLHPVALLDRHEKRDGNDEAHDQREYAKPIRRIREDAPRSPGVVDEADVEKASEGTEEDASRVLACKQALRQLVEDHPDNGHGGEYACLLLRIRCALGCHS